MVIMELIIYIVYISIYYKDLANRVNYQIGREKTRKEWS